MLTKIEQRLRRARQTRIRIAIQGIARLSVNRTNLHIYATVFSGDGTKVLASASTAEAEVRKELGAAGKGGNTALQISDIAHKAGRHMGNGFESVLLQSHCRKNLGLNIASIEQSHKHQCARVEVLGQRGNLVNLLGCDFDRPVRQHA